MACKYFLNRRSPRETVREEAYIPVPGTVPVTGGNQGIHKHVKETEKDQLVIEKIKRC